MSEALALVTVVIRATAARVQSSTELSAFRERDLQDFFVGELRETVERGAPEAIVRTGFGVKLEDWDRVGPVDVALCAEDSKPLAFFELKCGDQTLFNCVWDVAKMARARQLEQVPDAYLVAAAPLTAWQRQDGSEFFETRVFSTWTDLLERYRKHWAVWRTDVKTHPVVLPKMIRTTAIARSRFALEGADWELRCAAVAHGSSETIEVEPAGPSS